MKNFVMILYFVSHFYVISAVRIKCTKRFFTSRPNCGVIDIDPLTKKHDEVTEVTSDPYFRQNLSSIVDILFDSSYLQVEYLPEKSCTYFENLESFDSQMQHIKYISRGVFENCHKLKTIKIIKSKLRWTPVDTFLYLSELTAINLDENRLKYLPGNLIVQNHKLVEFSADFNELEIIDIQFPNTVTGAGFLGNVCISETLWNITTRNQLLANNCAATFSKIESLLEIEKLDTDVRCTSRYFTIGKPIAISMADSEIGGIMREVYHWQEAEVVLGRI